MKVKEITYVHSFNVGSFLNDKIGMTIEVNDGENVDDAIEFAVKKTKEIASEVQAGFQGTHEVVDRNPPLKVEQVSSHEIGITEKTLRSITDPKVLAIYEKTIDRIKDPATKTKLWLVYDEMYTQLNKLQTVKQ